MIKIEKLNKSFITKGVEKLDILKNFSLEIEKSDYISVMGTSGVGKTTLLNIIGLLESYESGNYIFYGKDVKILSEKELSKLRGEKIGYIFQDFLLLDDFSIYDNVLVSQLFDSKIKGKDIRQNVENAILKVGFTKDIMKKKVKLLSGGQKQRVAIARAIANNPDIILADEPTGSIDINSKEDIMNLFERLNLEGITIVLITHDENVANKAKKKYIFKDYGLEKVDKFSI